MLPLNGKMVNEHNIEKGYILIKTKKALKIMINIKGIMCIRARFLKNNVKINDIVEMINKSLQKNVD
jgi:hypothetical protein